MDELLLRRAQGGDPEAFEQLIGPLEQLVWRVCWHYTGNREAAEDCGQEAMIRIWRSLGSYRGDCAPESWVYRIAANCCMDWLRKKKRDRSESIEPLKEQGFDPADSAPGTEEQVVAADEHRRLREAIAHLPEDQREALVMTQLEKVPYEEAARLLQVSEGTVKSRVNRAKARLKEILSASGELSPPGNVQKDERRPRP
jgi:RNA polymerase sigma-70 factor (ECF subfamily)